jgi:hypothetical protein
MTAFVKENCWVIYEPVFNSDIDYRLLVATGPKGCGFEPGRGDWFFKGDKNPQHTFLSDGK